MVSLQNVLPLTEPGSEFLLYCHEWPRRSWERLLPFLSGSMEPGEVERRFGRYFDVERSAGELNGSKWIPGWAVYLMTRTDEQIK